MSDDFPIPDLEDDSPLRLPRVGVLLRSYREIASLTQSAAARLSYTQFGYRIAQPMIAAWETGEKLPTVASLERIAQVYAAHTPGADHQRILAHLIASRNNAPVAHTFDYEVEAVADRLQAHPRRDRVKLAKSLLIILKELEALLRLSPTISDNADQPEDGGDKKPRISSDPRPWE